MKCNRQTKLVVLLAIGVTVGAAVTAPHVGAHISSRHQHLWKAHLQKRADARYLPGAVLPPNVTLRGTWKVGGTNPSALGTTHATDAISFGYSFSAAPTVQFVPFGVGTTTECPGTFDAPQALPGYLCLYEENWFNNDWLHWDPAKPFGVNLFIFSLPSAGHFWCRGTWAATSM